MADLSTDAEGFKALVERMLSKAEVKDKKGFFESEEAGTGVKYEYEGGRWSLQDGETVSWTWTGRLANGLPRVSQRTTSRLCSSGFQPTAPSPSLCI